MAVFNLPAQNLTANQWYFSPETTVPSNISLAKIQATDPNNQWFTRPGNVKAWGLQLEGYVGAPWDNQAPWAGWGWWLYVPGGDVPANLANPAIWIPFGASVKGNGVSLPLVITVSSTQLIAVTGQRVRLAVQTDADIRLGATVTLT